MRQVPNLSTTRQLTMPTCDLRGTRQLPLPAVLHKALYVNVDGYRQEHASAYHVYTAYRYIVYIMYEMYIEYRVYI